MKEYKKHFQHYYMSVDVKPKGRDKHFCERKAREDAKREILKEIKDSEETSEPIESE